MLKWTKTPRGVRIGGELCADDRGTATKRAITAMRARPMGGRPAALVNLIVVGDLDRERHLIETS
jgi:hypothetical protein